MRNICLSLLKDIALEDFLPGHSKPSKESACGVFTVSRGLWGSREGHCGVRGQQPAERGVIMSLKNPATPPPCEEKPASMQPTHKRHLHRTQGHQLIDPLSLSLVSILIPWEPQIAQRGAGELGERTG